MLFDEGISCCNHALFVEGLLARVISLYETDDKQQFLHLPALQLIFITLLVYIFKL